MSNVSNGASSGCSVPLADRSSVVMGTSSYRQGLIGVCSCLRFGELTMYHAFRRFVNALLLADEGHIGLHVLSSRFGVIVKCCEPTGHDQAASIDEFRAGTNQRQSAARYWSATIRPHPRPATLPGRSGNRRQRARAGTGWAAAPRPPWATVLPLSCSTHRDFACYDAARDGMVQKLSANGGA